ncbi:MAG: class I SAM-dependent methyltransferase [Candidatus Gracilibacteria bacterium]|jgi:2-polyprenyl-3-methyl-5-hydroxy-6-metoxy-1,4-benzoquinol methylase|nr:class I SAM-dependent methyltransferase [Candidatus Gracilibacteria bacterium]
MNLSPEEKITLETYQKIAKEWAISHSNQDFWKKEFEVFNKILPKGKILEIGSGGGRDAKILIKSGYEYTGTDISTEFLKTAKAENPGAKFLHQSVYDLDFPEGTLFDGFYCSAVLLHIPKSKIDKAFDSVNKYLKPGAIGFISLKKGEGEKMLERQSESAITDKRFFVYYIPEEFKQILNRNGFEIIYQNEIQSTSKTTWLMFCVKKTTNILCN